MVVSVAAGAVVSGLAFGMVLFIASVGLTLVFGVMRVINFAHGSFYMFGAFFTFALISGGGGYVENFWVAAIMAALLVGVMAAGLEVTLFRPLYKHSYLYQFLLTFALVLVLDNIARIIWGTQFRSVSVPESLSFQMDLAATTVPAYNVFLILFGSSVAVLMGLVFKHTWVGKTVQITAEDPEIAGTLGVNVTWVYTSVFVVGAVLAGLAGALIAPMRAIFPAMGIETIILVFIVIIIGGMGSFVGALVGSLLIGLVRSFSFIVFPGPEPVIPFALLVVVLLLKPEGLFGEEAEGLE